ncbi:Kelch repeat-containing protein [Flaviaesturariibacter amylovorans]|uniref:Secretion system C-terminal sorting domain-containing protein n=1 Tax=Flaviaesturariibacter amylovorans TaxID=1084520 RepID=A0ABP8GF37_9BACT
MRKFLAAILSLACTAIYLPGIAQTTTVVKSFTTSGNIVFGAGVTTVNVSLWGAGGGGSGGGMTENPGNTPTFWCGAGGGGANWNGGPVSVTAGTSYGYAVGVGGAAGIIDGDGNPQWGGDGTGSAFGGYASYGAFGGRIYGWSGFGGDRALNPVPDPGIGYANNGGHGSTQRGGQGGLSNSGPYGPSAAPTFTNYNSGGGYPTPFAGYGGGVPGLRPGDGGGGGGYQTVPHFPIISSRKPGGRGADGIVTFYISYPTYRLTAAPLATRLCGSGTPTITLRSSSLSTGSYTVTYSTSNPATTGNTAFMSFNAATGTGTFSTMALSNTSTITVTNLASGHTCSDPITSNNSVVVIVDNTLPYNWNPQIDFGGAARSHAVGFVINNKAYVGLGKDGAGAKSDFWQFDPATNTWTQLADFGGGARAGAVGMGLGTKGYVGTGNDGSADKNDFWEYDPFTNVWTAKASFPGSARNGAAAMNIAGKGYVGTGVSGTTYYNDFYQYDPLSNAWTSKASFGGGASGTARTGAVAFGIGAKGYMGTGFNGSSAINDFWEYNPATNTWAAKPALPVNARTGAVGFAHGSRGYIGTGWNGTTNLNDFYVYNPANNGWLTSQNFPGAARSYGIGFSLGNRGFTGLGVSGTTYHKDMHEYTENTGRITTGSIAGNAFCAGAAISVPFSTGACPGGYNSENEFIAQLSDAYGSFANPVAIGSTRTAGGSIAATIPANTAVGAGYRIRVVATSSETFGSDNGSNIAVKSAAAGTVAAGISATAICRGGAISLTATASTAATSDTTVILSEHFNSGAPSWLITTANSYEYGRSEIAPSGFQGMYSNDNSPFYLTSSSGRFSNDVTNSTLQSPMFSTVGMNSGSLSFWHHYYYGNYQNSDSIRVQVSIDNGQSWTNVYLNNTITVGDAMDSLGFRNQTVSLDQFMNQPSVVVRFNYGAYGGMGRWAIDNIVIKGVSKSNNFTWTSSPAGFHSTAQNPTGIVPALVPGTTSYTVTLANNFGCGASSGTVSVLVKDTSSSTTRISICPSELPFQWNGLSFSGAGTQIAHLTNAAGCDSLAKLVLTVRLASSSTTNISICPPELPFTWNGLVFNTGGAQTAHFTNSVGCDSAATLNLTVKLVSTYTQNLTICESALPYSWNGVVFNAAGSNTVHFTNAAGCDSAVTLNLATTASVTTATATATSVCPGAVISLSAAASSGATVTVLKEGFNSTHNDWTKINLSSGGLTDSAAWTLRPHAYEPYFGLPAFTSNDNSAFYMTSSYAQGTAVTTHTILQSPLFSTVGLTSASMNFYHQFTHQNNFANDSIRVQISNDGTTWTNLYVNKNASVGFNSLFSQQTISLNGYLNLATLRLRFVYNGTPMPGGYSNYWWSIDNVVVTGTIAASTFSWTSAPAGFTSSLQHPPAFSPTQSTVYTLNVTNGYCAATRHVAVTMNATNPTSVTHLTVCPSSMPYTWNGLVFETAGTQTATIRTAGNCDSLATLHLTIGAQSSSVTHLTICPSGLPFTWNGLVFTAAGTKTKLIATGAACDSAATLVLSVQTSSTSSVTNLTICDNQLPYTWNGLVFTSAGTQVKMLTNAYGCDSAATLHLAVSARPTSVTAAASVTSFCVGSTVNLTASGVAGTVIFEEQFNNGAPGWTTQNLGTGGTPAQSAWTIRASGYVYPELNQTFRSNDNSMLYLSNSRAQGIGSTTNAYLQSPVFSTVGFTTASLGFYHHFVSNNNDSIRIQVSTDYGSTWKNVYFRTLGIQGSSSAFEPATVSLNAYVNQPALMLRFHYSATYDYYWTLDNVKITGTAAPLAYSWSSVPAGFSSALQNPAGVTPTQSGTYTVQATNSAGCSASASVVLTAKATSSSTTNLSVCPSALPFVWNGLNITAAGSRTARLTNSVNCDSLATLNLSLSATSTSQTTTSVCPGSFPFTWNSLTFHSAGTQTRTLVNSAGCDSIASYTVTVRAASTSSSNLTLCASALPYTWNGVVFTTAGSQTAHLLNSVGCDSAATLVLSVNPLPANLTVGASATTVCAGTAISLSASATSGSPSTVVLDEKFNSATNGWTRINNSVGGNASSTAWNLRASDGSLKSNDNTQHYISLSVNLDYGGTTRTTLQSPAFSTVGLSDATLTFYHNYNHNPYAYDSIRVQVSTDGSTWKTVYLNNSTSVGTGGVVDAYQMTLQTLSLSNYVNQPNVRIRFDYNAAWQTNWWAIDNVKVSGSPLSTYSWTSSPAGFTSAASAPAGIVPAHTTTYTVAVSNAFGCTATDSVRVVVNPLPSAAIAYGFSNCVSGATATVALDGSAGGVFSAPAGLALHAATGAVSLPGSTPGTYTVTYTIPAANGCPAFSTTAPITIDPTYQILVGGGTNGTITPGGIHTLCAGSTRTFTITPNACYEIEDVQVDFVSVGPVTSYTFDNLGADHSITATFRPLSVVPTIDAGGATYVCSGGSVTLTASDAASYQWFYGNARINGATAQTYSATLVGEYKVVVTYANGCTGTSAPKLLLASAPAASISGTATVCQNGTAQVTFIGTGAIIPYTFTYSINGGPVQTATTSTGSSVSVPVPTGTAGSFTYALVSVQSASGCSAAPGGAVTIVVEEQPNAAISYPGSPYLAGSGTAAVTHSGKPGGSYTSASGLSIDGSTGAIDLVASSVGTYVVTYTIAASGSCAAYSATANVEISSPFSAAITYEGSPYCALTGTASVTLTGSAGGTYSAAPGLSINSATGAIDLALSLPGTYVVTYSPAVSGYGTPVTTEVSIRPTVFINPIPNQVICAGASLAPVHFSGPAGQNYTWTNSNDSIGLGASGAGDYISFESSNAGTTSLIATITVTASGGTGCKDPRRRIFRITVKPRPTIDLLSNQALCAGTATTPVTFISSLAGTSIRWTNSNPGIGLGASGTGNIPAFTAQNGSLANEQAYINVFPTAGGCAGRSEGFIYTVSPSAGTIAYPLASYCAKSWAYVRRTGSAGGTFTATPAGLALNATTGAINLAVSAAGIYTVTYTLGGPAPGCATSTSTQLTVEALATMNTVSNITVCNGTNTQPVVFSGAAGYSWTNSNPAIGLVASGNSSGLPSFVATNTGVVPISGTIRVTPLAAAGASCPGRSISFRITVNPTPTVTSVPNQLYCGGVATSAIGFTGTVAATAYSWTSSSTGTGLLATRGINSVPSFLTTSPAPGPVTANIVVTPVAYKCTGAPMTFQYQVAQCVAQVKGTGDAERAPEAASLESAVTIGPNPTQGRATISYTGPEGSFLVRITDQNGQALQRPASFSGNRHTIDLSGYPAGVYLVELIGKEHGTRVQRKVVKL